MSLLGVIIGVLGLALSLLLFLIQRIKNYPGQLCYSILDCSKIVEKKESSFKDVSLQYKDYNVEDSLFYVKILVFNQRTFDVKAETSESSISLLLSNESKWLDVGIKHESEGVGSSVCVDEKIKHKAYLSFPLLRKEESILIEGLIESSLSISDNEESILRVNHRISGLDAFKYIPVVTERMYKRCKRMIKIMGSIMGITLLIMVFTLFRPYRSPILYNNICDPKDSTEYRVELDKKERIIVDEYQLISLRINSGRTIPKEEFELNYRPAYHFHESYVLYYNIGSTLMLFFLLVYLLYYTIREIGRYKLLSRFK